MHLLEISPSQVLIVLELLTSLFEGFGLSSYADIKASIIDLITDFCRYYDQNAYVYISPILIGSFASLVDYNSFFPFLFLLLAFINLSGNGSELREQAQKLLLLFLHNKHGTPQDTLTYVMKSLLPNILMVYNSVSTAASIPKVVVQIRNEGVGFLKYVMYLHIVD